MTETTKQAQVVLGDRPRLEIALDPGTPGALQTGLVICLPSPTAEQRPEGRFLADPRLPESDVLFAWSQLAAVPRALHVLTVSTGGETWVLEQDVHHPDRWRLQGHSDHWRAWS